MLKNAIHTVMISGFLAAATGAAANDNVILSVQLGTEQRSFTLEELQTMPVTSVETTTIWTEGLQNFEGVQLKDLLENLGVQPEQIEAIAVNDYAVEIPASDAIDGGPIVAYFQNGNTMPLRTKGPLWIVYPYDAHKKYRTESIYSRSIWQLDRLIIQ
ncbi:molybdopterin-dependent oxidoreductase [Puniceibacterium sp. IMCC21224]|uniref:molybdopterin-dependent oxidoreductase n=1 Tax=Puniceibacterium sp. IMCC21224 TaxID=1618204 RepID=UPI00064DE34F|nr:molybdopterin-dependent oxidoreductase [Puniceibacterium sp. IMCC21224]KMK67818.1 hypothetical protein IMCC21224_112693 [Puniceibacterium sp. IMCC21224]